MKLYAIGDIHGCFNELLDVMSQIVEDANGPHKIVFLGDYVDRGPDSALVVDYLDNLRKNPGGNEYVFLRGNHEDMLLDHFQFYDMHVRESNFIYNGGRQTLQSYEENNLIIDDHLDFYDNLELYHIDEEFFFVHAGLSGYVTSFKDIQEFDCLWGRYFVDWKGKFMNNFFVIHGHTPVDNPYLLPNQLNIDTGCVFGGKLTAVRIDSREEFKFFHSKNKALQEESEGL